MKFIAIIDKFYFAILSILRQKGVRRSGFTLVELLISIAIMGTLAGIATIGYRDLLTKVRNNTAINDIKKIEVYIDIYLQENGKLPETLDDLGMGPFVDPWGNPYRYQDLEKVPKGMWRKNRFQVPLNDFYDLWSMGADGKSVAPLTAQASRDDIVRAYDGGFIGLASQH